MVRSHSMVHVSVCFHENHVGSQHPQLYQQTLWKKMKKYRVEFLELQTIGAHIHGHRLWRQRKKLKDKKTGKQGHGRSEAWKSANEIGNNKDNAKKLLDKNSKSINLSSTPLAFLVDLSRAKDSNAGDDGEKDKGHHLRLGERARVNIHIVILVISQKCLPSRHQTWLARFCGKIWEHHL